ncbi:uncharacterized protein [Eucyclogobius newberryi]|uniref:uncharacterized protein n=1 Tax=Eucyclogobius newberryi TaxID=166745 RepID=UPI003B5C14C1
MRLVFTTITVTQEIIERAGTNTTQAPTVTNGTTPTINATTPTINLFVRQMARVAVEARVRKEQVKRMCACVWLETTMMRHKANVFLLDKAYETNKEYRGSTVTKLSKNTATPAKIMRTAGILATVEIKFDKDSTVKAEEVKKTASDAYPSFQATDLCASNPCDETTTKCSGAEGSFTCDCTDSYVPTVLSDRLCVACPNSYEAVGQICKQCGFGYSGLNCKDNWQLILVIVGSLLSALLLITIIVSTVMALKTKKKLKKGKATDYAKPNLNPAPVRNPHVSNGSAVPRPTPVQASPAGGRPGFGGNVMPRIPRATANEGWDRSNLEMAPSNSRQNLIPAGRNSRRFDEHDDPYSRPNPQNNPYGMGRPQVNPYASNQGHSNPYFRNDN